MRDVERFSPIYGKFFLIIWIRTKLKASAHRALAAFVGRAAVRGDKYAPLANVQTFLREARDRLHCMAFEVRRSLPAR